MLDKALQYISRGASIIPLRKNKKPYLNTWKEYQSRIATKEEVEEWWRLYPDAQIGIVTGKLTNLAVVDVEFGGDKSIFPQTDMVTTGNGGWHLYYVYVEGAENRTRAYPLVDVRGEGGYVVAPPSVTDYISDKKEELGQRKGGKYDFVLPLVGRQPFPIGMFNDTKKNGKWDFELLNGVAQGSRNDSATKIIGKILTLYPNTEWDSAWEFVKAWNELKNSPPLSEWELHNVFLSIAKREIKKNPNKTVVEKLEKNTPRITLTDVVESASREILGTKESDIVSFGYDFLNDQLTGIFRGELVVIGGESGTGKTTFATNIIYNNSKDRKCYIFALEDRLNYYGAKVLYFKINELRSKQGRKKYPWNDFIKNTLHDPAYLEIHERAKNELHNDNIEFYGATEMMNIETMEAIITNKISEGVELFLIDHLHYFDLSRGSQSKADYVEQVMVRLKTIQNKTGARVILVVHFRKLNGQKPTLDSFKDSISIVQNANYVINLWRDRSLKEGDKEFFNETEMYIPKARNPNGEASFTLKFDRDKNDYEKVNKSYGTPQEEITQNEINF